MNVKLDQPATASIRGYLEGYYAQLLSWSERADVVRFMAAQNLSTYCYAPKEDIQHRLRWREPYSSQWHDSFGDFCRLASDVNIAVVAGIAPGLDFNFIDSSDLASGNTSAKDSSQVSKDFDHLQKKASALMQDGADHILILWDDIDASCYVDNGISEGTAHARVVNQLSKNMDRPVWTVPRVYAAEIDNNNHYLEDFFAELDVHQVVLLCGNAIVAETITPQDLRKLSTPKLDVVRQRTQEQPQRSVLGHRLVLWDNFYANDYCPRQLFVGPWTGREHIGDFLLNPTGLPYTDQLLLDVALSTHTSTDIHTDWMQALKRHGVPEAFFTIAPYFSKPFFGDREVLGDNRDLSCVALSDAVADAIETCLWQWKSPLAREWYPFIMGLKHDLALMQNELPRVRVLKTQSPALAIRLLKDSI